MARLFYMSLKGIGDWSAAMGEAGAQLDPYRRFISTAKDAVDRQAFSLSWRRPDPDERDDLEHRRENRDPQPKHHRPATRSRDHRQNLKSSKGEWIILQSPYGRAEEPESTFRAFLDADDVYSRGPERDGNRFVWPDEARVAVLGVDREANALFIAYLPVGTSVTGIDAENDDERPVRKEPLLFLRPNTWPLECQRQALQSLENRPFPRVAPLIRLVSTRPVWPDVQRETVPEHAWTFLRREADGSMRDGATEQREFVEHALGTPDFAVLEGPPGSGKTTAICELIIQLTRANKRVLLVASTHVAVDNVLERLVEWQERGKEKLVLPIRIGDEGSVTSNTVKPWTLSNLRRSWRLAILEFIEDSRSGQSVGLRARDMLKQALIERSDDSGFANMILDASNLICGTTIGILQHPPIKAARQNRDDIEPFDFMILDEASKTTFTEFLVPARYSSRWVVVGDRRQLSPYVEEEGLIENLRGLVPQDVSRAAVHAFAASTTARSGMPARSLIAVESDHEADLIAAEAKARGVTTVDLDRVAPATLYGVENACAQLLYAEIVYGKPDTIRKWEHRLPGDLESASGPVPRLPAWEAHRRALQLNSSTTSPDWAKEVGWRLIRAYELRENAPESARLNSEIRALLPTSLDEEYFRERRRRNNRNANPQSPVEALDSDVKNIRRVAMPSILEVLQVGAGSIDWNQETALTAGLPKPVLRQRLVSLSFQHRMHPDISSFPRMRFYADAGLLKDASGMQAAREWGYRRYRRRAVWVDIEPSRTPRTQSKPKNINETEATALLNELQEFVRWAASAPHPGSHQDAPWEVAVLTFYRDQEVLLRTHLQRLSEQKRNTTEFWLPASGPRVHVTLCTADRFQGHEADIVFVSFVRSGSVGFLNSPNRLNVALTRARYQLVLIGHRSWMSSSNCRSDLLRALGESPHYANNIGWENP